MTGIGSSKQSLQGLRSRRGAVALPVFLGFMLQLFTMLFAPTLGFSRSPMPVDVEARSQGVEFRPAWMESGKPINNANCSYFSDRAVQEWNSSSAENWIQETVMNPGMARGLRADYENRYSTYELRTFQGLQSHETDRAFFEGTSKFSTEALDKIKTYNREQGLARARDMVTTDSRVKSIFRKIKPYMGPLAIVGAVWSFYFGTPAEWQVAESTKVSARWCGKTPEMSAIPFLPNCVSQSGSFSILSPVVNSSFEVTSQAPVTSDPFSQYEHMKFSVSRELPWNMSTGLTYGQTSGSVSASLSKQVTEHITAVVDSRHPISAEVAAIRPTEETVKVLYAIRF